MIHRFPFRAVVGNRIEVSNVEILARNELRNGALVPSEKWCEINREVSHDWQVPQRFDAKPIAHCLDQRAARELFAAIDHHRARAAHSHAARETERQIRARTALQREKDIQNARLFRNFDLMRFETRFFAHACGGALDVDGDSRHASNMSTRKACCNSGKTRPRAEGRERKSEIGGRAARSARSLKTLDQAACPGARYW